MVKPKKATQRKNLRAGKYRTVAYSLQSFGLAVICSCLAMVAMLIVQKANNHTDQASGYITNAFILFRVDFLVIFLFWGICNAIVWTCYKRYREQNIRERLKGYTLAFIGTITGGFFLPYATADLKASVAPLPIVIGMLLLSTGFFLSLGVIIRLIIIKRKKEPRWEFPMFV